MAYFSNGTEGLDYQEQYCFRCEYWPEDDTRNCPIWAAHQFYAYSEHGKPGAAILDMLIPMVPHTFKDKIAYTVAGECTFFRLKQERLPL